MIFIEKLFNILQTEMPEPQPYGWFHLLCIGLFLLAVFFLYTRKNNYGEKQLKYVLATYGIVAFILEMLKQISWSVQIDPITSIMTWEYEWYSFPFQLCTTPIYVCLICLFLKKGKLRNSLFSYMSYITILGSIMTVLLPETCLVSDILVNIHTMWLHLGSLVVSVYLLMNEEVKVDKQSLISAIYVFLVFVTIALCMNIVVYHTGILNGDSFDMFYISPYFISTLPVFDVVQQNVPYVVFLLTYIFALSLGGYIIYTIAKIFKYKIIMK